MEKPLVDKGLIDRCTAWLLRHEMDPASGHALRLYLLGKCEHEYLDYRNACDLCGHIPPSEEVTGVEKRDWR